MRVLTGGISHETNTFRSGFTEVQDFKGREWSIGDEIIARHRGVHDNFGALIENAGRLGVELIPTFYTTAPPSATISHAAYDETRSLLLNGIRDAGNVDALCLRLHGAGVAEGIDDIEGALLKDIRALVGPDVPIVVTLDLHGNLTQEMLEYSDALFGVHHYPHTDFYDRGQEAIELIPRLLRGQVKPVMHLTKLPLIIPLTTANLSPIKEINERCWQWETEPGVLDCVFFHGFPQADIPIAGVSVLAMTDNDPALARKVSEDVARMVWELRDAFRVEPTPPAEAFRRATAAPGQPVVLNEASDNPGGGGPGDGTHLLRAMIDAGLSDACYGSIFDPETAAQAHAAGIGQTIDVALGGKIDPMHGEPIRMPAYVKALSDGRFIQQSPVGRGAQIDLGKMARLVIGGIDVLVYSQGKSQTLDAEVFLLHGIDVMRYKIVALKSSNHFRAGFEPLAAEIIRVDTPGLVSADLFSYPYRRITRPIAPLDEDVEWQG
ncbi:MAG TPA: M81 family metallopeptidase [Nitrolancea sp.]|nr:M81 family metallopeptidase [Nitrolancea sp.]